MKDQIEVTELQKTFYNKSRKELTELLQGDLLGKIDLKDVDVIIQFIKDSENYCFSLINLSKAALLHKNIVDYQNIEKVTENAIKSNEEISKELNEAYSSKPDIEILLKKVDGIIKRIRKD